MTASCPAHPGVDVARTQAPASSDVVSAVLLFLIRLYQRAVARWIPPVCRFYPSCSRYTAEAIRVWGPWRGSWMGFRRICRCNPTNPGGLDPVPLPEEVV